MKWRFKSDEIRVRLSPEDKEALINGQALQNEYSFGLQLVLLTHVKEDDPVLLMQDETLSLTLPRENTIKWLQSKDMSLKATINDLNILIEKDLSCSHSSAPLDEKKYFGHKFD